MRYGIATFPTEGVLGRDRVLPLLDHYTNFAASIG